MSSNTVSIACPFPSLQKDKLVLLAEKDPLLAHKKILDEALLTNRVATSILELLAAYALVQIGVPIGSLLIAGACLSTPSTALSLGSYWLCQGTCLILGTSEPANLFQNTLMGGLEVAAAGSLLYFHNIQPIGIVEPLIQQRALATAKDRENHLYRGS